MPRYYKHPILTSNRRKTSFNHITSRVPSTPGNTMVLQGYIIDVPPLHTLAPIVLGTKCGQCSENRLNVESQSNNIHTGESAIEYWVCGNIAYSSEMYLKLKSHLPIKPICPTAVLMANCQNDLTIEIDVMDGILVQDEFRKNMICYNSPIGLHLGRNAPISFWKWQRFRKINCQSSCPFY